MTMARLFSNTPEITPEYLGGEGLVVPEEIGARMGLGSRAKEVPVAFTIETTHNDISVWNSFAGGPLGSDYRMVIGIMGVGDEGVGRAYDRTLRESVHEIYNPQYRSFLVFTRDQS
jgi:hypothetical protein